MLSSILSFINCFSQAAAYTDPAQAYLRLMLEKNPSATIRVGAYKVMGTPNLFGDKHNATVYLNNASSQTMQVGYNTYTQELEISNNGEIGSIKTKEIDSFYLNPGAETEGFSKPILFINGKHVGAKENAFYQRIYTGGRVNLYKKYYCDLGVVSVNYVQAELRQFDLKYEFYYADTVAKSFKKIKLANASVIKEFKSIKDVSTLIENVSVSSNPEFILTKIMIYLNE